jgi:hypothetical protein
MPATPDPRNTFEVTVPPLLGQDQSFEFTFCPASPGPVVSLSILIILLLTCMYQTVKISMGPCPTGPVDPPRVSICTPAPPSIPLARKPSTPLRVSVNVSPIHVQRTPPRTLVSRGLSPVPFENLLPPDIAAFFNSTQMQLTQGTQVSPARPPVRLPDSEVISVTSSESDSENIRKGLFLPSRRTRTRARSPEIVAETQVMMDPLVRRRLPFCRYVYAHSRFPDGPDVGQGSPAEA